MTIVKVCKMHGPLHLIACFKVTKKNGNVVYRCKECDRISANKRYHLNPARAREKQRRMYQKHREKRDAAKSVWVKNNPEKVKEFYQKWKNAQPPEYFEKRREIQRETGKEEVESLSDNYIKALLKKQFRNYSRDFFSDDLVELKRNLLKIKRQIIKVKNGN